jgi:hypothetical protein
MKPAYQLKLDTDFISKVQKASLTPRTSVLSPLTDFSGLLNGGNR